MAQITFHDEQAHEDYHGMAEGMSEVAEDNGETERAASLDALIVLTGANNSPYPLTFELPAEMVEIAETVLENLAEIEGEPTGVTIGTEG